MVKNWAIVIGINYYEHLPLKKHLKCAVQDAEAMKAFLCNSAGFPSENILFCSDHSQPVSNIPTRPSRTNLRRILFEKSQQAFEADNFWFFFAGHGISKNWQDYLLPCDADANDPETAISIRDVVDCLRRCRAKNIVLVLDMCREGELQPSGSRGVSEVGEETIKITHQQGIITIFSCQLGKESYEIVELKQGAFTHVLLNGLQQNMILRQLEQYLRREVPYLNRKYDKPVQEPLVIPEPGLKYDLPLFPELVKTKGNNNDLRSQQTGTIGVESRGQLQTSSQHEKIQEQIQVLDAIIEDAKSNPSFANVRERFLQWRKKTKFFLSEEVGKQEALTLVMISPRGDFKTDKARLLNEATQIRNYLLTLSQNLN